VTTTVAFGLTRYRATAEATLVLLAAVAIDAACSRFSWYREAGKS
jgi:hypothetical protein